MRRLSSSLVSYRGCCVLLVSTDEIDPFSLICFSALRRLWVQVCGTGHSSRAVCLSYAKLRSQSHNHGRKLGLINFIKAEKS
ncbi:hypothetical protein Ae201684P_014381 [Aphanomyces euteiches]|uniref:Uncharacterized protein n=1 Tax=Aphanomyces euteiches TaxID=100861 RepID=A0A6G0WYK8_9STRA|nr:hypothetical protein Ae201684_010309 [Aphanomyces euteiches]KAH9090583.1 hypothetical protein Ae201684P_014381 [Aphanomyces euteiches]